jgi:hypothetical protein
MTNYEAEYRDVARRQYVEIERLRGLVAQRDKELSALITWISGDEDALSALRAIYADPRQSPANVIKAAGLCLPFERSKPASVVVQIDFKQRVHDARMRAMERDKARWALEDAAKAKVIEHQGTILASDHEGLDPADPAA